jgi:hypothetical protein
VSFHHSGKACLSTSSWKVVTRVVSAVCMHSEKLVCVCVYVCIHVRTYIHTHTHTERERERERARESERARERKREREREREVCGHKYRHTHTHRLSATSLICPVMSQKSPKCVKRALIHVSKEP